MKIYLDNCSLQRPLDDKTQPRIRVEAEAITEILLLCRSNFLTLVSSKALEIEVEETSNSKRRLLTFSILSSAKETVSITVEVGNRAREFEKRGFRQFDALHLALAEVAQVDYFCTCDDKFLKKAKAQTDLKTNAVSPLELIQELF